MSFDDAAMQKMIRPDGSLYDLGRYVFWLVGSDSVTLDGEFFTSDQLRWIADYMDRVNGEKRNDTERTVRSS